MILADALTPISFAITFGLVVLSLGVALSVVRLWIGPSLSDRVVALDMIATLLVGMLILDALSGGGIHSLRVATVLALVNFVGTVGFALYLSKKGTS